MGPANPFTSFQELNSKYFGKFSFLLKEEGDVEGQGMNAV